MDGNHGDITPEVSITFAGGGNHLDIAVVRVEVGLRDVK